MKAFCLLFVDVVKVLKLLAAVIISTPVIALLLVYFSKTAMLPLVLLVPLSILMPSAVGILLTLKLIRKDSILIAEKGIEFENNEAIPWHKVHLCSLESYHHYSYVFIKISHGPLYSFSLDKKQIKANKTYKIVDFFKEIQLAQSNLPIASHMHICRHHYRYRTTYCIIALVVFFILFVVLLGILGK